MNIYLIKSPLQLLNAIEASYILGYADDILVVRFTTNYNTNKQIDNLLKLKEWGTVIKINYSKWSLNFIKEFTVLKELQKRSFNFDKIFIGDYRMLNFKLFGMNLPHKETYLLDDGTGTFTMQDFYLKDQKEYLENYYLETLKKTIAKFVYGFRVQLREKINLFTCYNLQPHTGQKVIRNNYTFSKNKILNSKELQIIDDVVFFIGAKYVEENLMKEEMYFSELKKCANYFKGKTLIYLPHRGENIEKLTKIESMGIQVKRIENILELHFLLSREIPFAICGFTSSVLVNIPKIFKEIKVFTFKIEESKFEPHYQGIVKNFYFRFVENENLKLFELD